MNLDDLVREVRGISTKHPPAIGANADQVNAAARELFLEQGVPWTQDGLRGFLLGACVGDVMPTHLVGGLIACVAMEIEL
jgi:hypothetical protein